MESNCDLFNEGGAALENTDPSFQIYHDSEEKPPEERRR